MYQSLGVEVIDLCAPLKFGFLRFDVAWHVPTDISVFIQLHNVITWQDEICHVFWLPLRLCVCVCVCVCMSVCVCICVSSKMCQNLSAR